MMKKPIFAVALPAFLAFPQAFAEEIFPEKIPAAAITAPEKPAEETAAAPTRISRVVVFPDRARVTRSAKISLREGEQEILLAGMPEFLPEAELSAGTTVAGAKIAAVAVEEKRSRKIHDRAAEKTAEENLKQKELALKKLRSRIAALELRAKQTESLAPTVPAREATGTPYAFDLAAARRGLNFSQNELGKTLAEIRELKTAAELADLDVAVARSEFEKIAAAFAHKENSEFFVRVKIIADAPSAGEIFVDYTVTGCARWAPSYDLHVDPAGKSVTLISYGVVSQETGEDWDGVPVTLSTARPNVSADLPEFKKIAFTQIFSPAKKSFAPVPAAGSLSFAASGNISARDGGGKSFSVAAKKAESRSRDAQRFVIDNDAGNAIVFADGRTAQNARDVRFFAGNFVFRNAAGILEKAAAGEVAQISQNSVETARDELSAARLRDPARDLRGLDFRYDLARAETVKSGARAHRYLLASEKFSGDFYYRVEPSVNENAYRMVAIENPNFRPILAGPANIFFGADFIGEMDFPYTVRDGNVSIPLGVDPRVAVERQKINAIETVGTFSPSRRNNVAVSVKIRNRTPEKIRVLATEAVPVSAQKEIEISDVKFSPRAAEFSEENGIARWDETLEPAETAEIRVDYRIDYPKNFELRESKRSR